MTSSNLAANHFIPFLFRILLCAVFVPIGWSGIMGLETFSGEDAAVLESLEVAPAPESPESEAPDAFEARQLYSLSILLAKKTLPRPVFTAWALTLVALAGGSLLLLGLFTRLWAFALATYMGLLFWCNSLDALQADSNIFQADASLLLHAGGILALGFIALSLIFTGAGALSLDQAIFAHHSSSQHDYEEEAEESE